MTPPVQLLMAHNSSGTFSDYDRAPHYLEKLLVQSGVRVESRTLIDNAQHPQDMELPRGWQRHLEPNATSEFESWTSGLAGLNNRATVILCTSAVVKRQVRGGATSLRVAASSRHPCAPIGRTRWPYWAEGRWFTGYAETSCFTLPPDWPRDWPLNRYRWTSLDATFNPRDPFGPQCELPVGVRELAWWWVTYPRSGYSRTRRATPGNMSFIYTKVLAVCNEAVLGVRIVKSTDTRKTVKPQDREPPSISRLQEVTASTILAGDWKSLLSQVLGDGIAVTRSRLALHSARLEVSRAADVVWPRPQ